MGTYKIVEARALSEAVFEMWIHAPQVALHAKAGQFCIVHPDGAGERVPLTISGTDGEISELLSWLSGRRQNFSQP